MSYLANLSVKIKLNIKQTTKYKDSSDWKLLVKKVAI